MSCPYYWYNYHYACRKSGKDVNEDTYDRYCKNYDYGDCPIYKGNDTSGCFLTSACVEARGLPDDCHELTVLRAFRDGYMRSLPSGATAICEYYNIAPVIVDKIKEIPNANEIFDQIYQELVLPCVDMIEEGKNSEAYRAYASYVNELKHQYL